MRMLQTSKSNDKKRNIFDCNTFIDYSSLLNLIGECESKCCYCACDMIYDDYSHKMISIERIDVSKGHIKGNCTLSCKDCNIGKAQRESIGEKYICPCGAKMGFNRRHFHVKTSQEHKRFVERTIDI